MNISNDMRHNLLFVKNIIKFALKNKQDEDKNKR